MPLQQLSLEDAIAQAEAAPPQVSAVDIAKNVATQTCPCCGHAERVYRRALRPAVVRGLAELVRVGPMTTGELVRRFQGGLAASIKSYFAEAVLWGFVDKDQAGRWHPTSKAGRFLNGELQVWRHVWPRDKQLPASCADSELVYVEDVVPAESWCERGGPTSSRATPACAHMHA